jgi:hypothetical protein
MKNVIDVNLVVQDFLKTIDIPKNASVKVINKLPIFRE